MQKNTSGAEPNWDQWPAHPAEIGCAECAWGKVAGCWKCGSRISDIPRIQADIDRAHAEEVRLGMHDVGGAV